MVRKKIMNFVLLYLLLVGVLFFMQRSMIYVPDRIRYTPESFGKESVFSIVQTHTPDGVSLEGWYAPPRSSQPVILWFHGNAGEHGRRSLRTSVYTQEGYGVLLAGYRGYGGNAGAPSEGGLYTDAKTWIDFLLTQGIVMEDIVLYGESLGSGVAVEMAVLLPTIRALILESPYTSLPDVAIYTWFFVPVHWLMKDQFRSLAKADQIRSPVLIFQGLRDRVIPPVHGRRLYQALINAPMVQIQVFPEHGHNNLPNDVLARHVMDFLEESHKVVAQD